MVKISDFTFFQATPELRELTLLQEISKDPKVTQEKLARSAGIATSMANVYIKDFCDRGLITKDGDNRRNMDYHITAKGEERRQELSTFFIIETVMLYKRSKELFSTQIGELRLLGIEEIMLFGASDTCEMVSAVAERYGLKVLGIVDSDPNKHGSTFCGRQVQDPSLILKLKPQAVIITSSGNIDEIAASLTEAQAHGIKIVKLQV